MIVLGFNGGPKRAETDDIFHAYLHDAAAVLMKDGELLYAIEEERLNRIKHTNCFPSRAIDYCMKSSGMTWGDLDAVVYVSDSRLLTASSQWNALEDMVAPVPLNAESFIALLLEREFGIDLRPKLSFCDHHDAHIWSTFPFSGFEEALVVSIDGEGDGRAGMIGVVQNTTVTTLREYLVPQSLGNLYTAIIRLLGYGRFDEYKAMGLAPYGDSSVFKHIFDKGHRLLPKGHYILDPLGAWAMHFQTSGILQQARRKGEPFSKVHMDLAAALQCMLEKIVLHVLSHFQRETGLRSLCLAGGVAHNCTLNGKILHSGLFDKVFVQPASHDAGGALGAACWVLSRKAAATKVKPIRHVYLGTGVPGSDDIVNTLTHWADFLSFERCGDIIAKTAALIAEGAVVGWFQGRSEFGPRALGNRSILADPRPAANKDLINKMVKTREQFRPFAPSVIEERVNDFFDVPECEADLSYMTYVLSVREPMRSSLGAVTHIDGTARLQTVSRQASPRYWELISEFGRVTGFPILLNTSFNNDAEPIVDSIEDAVICFLTTGINVLVVGEYLIRKCLCPAPHTSWLKLVPSVAVIRRLVKYNNGSGTVHRIESTKGTPYGRVGTGISSSMYGLLSRSDEKSTIAELLGMETKSDSPCALVEELNHLWCRRMIRLRPSG